MSKFLTFIGKWVLRLIGIAEIPGVGSALFGGAVAALAAFVLIPTGIAAAHWFAKPAATDVARIEGANTQTLTNQAALLAAENRALKEAAAKKDARIISHAEEVSAFQSALETKERDNAELRERAPDPHAPVFGPDDPWLTRRRVR
jgi:hypothetical protein